MVMYSSLNTGREACSLPRAATTANTGAIRIIDAPRYAITIRPIKATKIIAVSIKIYSSYNPYYTYPADRQSLKSCQPIY